MKEISDQKRMVIAAVLSLLVIVAWTVLYRPAAPPPGTAISPTPSTAVPAGIPPAGAPTDGTTSGAAQPAGPVVAASVAASAAAVGDAARKTLVVAREPYPG